MPEDDIANHNLAKSVARWDTELLSDQLRILIERSNHVPGNIVGCFDTNCPLCQVYAAVNDEMNRRNKVARST